MVALRGVVGTLWELVALLWARKLWWLIPAVLVLVLFGAVMILGSAAGIGPFIYTLF